VEKSSLRRSLCLIADGGSDEKVMEDYPIIVGELPHAEGFILEETTVEAITPIKVRVVISLQLGKKQI
jgi:hypothetical protein